MLCSACIECLHVVTDHHKPDSLVVTRDHLFGEDKPHHITKASFLEAVAKHCYICKNVQRKYRIDQSISDDPRNPDSTPFTFIGPSFHSENMMKFRVSFSWSVDETKKPTEVSWLRQNSQFKLVFIQGK
jgi:hypothetical protein